MTPAELLAQQEEERNRLLYGAGRPPLELDLATPGLSLDLREHPRRGGSLNLRDPFDPRNVPAEARVMEGGELDLRPGPSGRAEPIYLPEAYPSQRPPPSATEANLVDQYRERGSVPDYSDASRRVVPPPAQWPPPAAAAPGVGGSGPPATTPAPAPTRVPRIAAPHAGAPDFQVPKLPEVAPPSLDPVQLSLMAAQGGEHYEAPRDFRPELAQAREKSAQLRLLAGMGRASAQLGHAFSGPAAGKFDDSAYRGVEDMAGIPEAQVQEDMRLEAVARAAREHAETNDPNSRSNVAFRERLRGAMPGFAAKMGTAFGNVTRAQFDKTYPGMVQALGFEATQNQNAFQRAATQANIEVNVQGQRAQAQQHAADMGLRASTANAQLGFQAAQLDETGRHNRAMEGVALTNAERDRNRFNEITDERVRDQRFSEHLVKLGNESAKFSNIKEAFQMLEEAAPGMVTKGVTPKDFELTLMERAALKDPTGIGTWLASDKAKLLKGRLDQIQELITRLRTGAVVNDKELSNAEQWFQNYGMADPEGIAPRVRDLARLTARGMKDKQLAYSTIRRAQQDPASPTVLQKWVDMGGSSYLDPLFAGLDASPGAPPAANPGTQQASAGGKVTPSGKPYANKKWHKALNRTRYLDAAGAVVEEADGLR